MTLISLNSLISQQEYLTEMIGGRLPALKKSNIPMNEAINGLTQKGVGIEAADG
jgi:hypothetical protein